jgi:hypothetical protein
MLKDQQAAISLMQSASGGPQQTDDWPLVWSDLDPGDLPNWVTWRRICQRAGGDGQPCPRRWAGRYFGVWHCDKHWPDDVPRPSGAVIG